MKILVSFSYVASLTCIGLVFFLACTRTKNHPTDITPTSATDINDAIKKLEALETQMQVYKCESMVSVVNSLRHLGKERALQTMQAYYDKTRPHSYLQDQMNIICVSRTLFVPPPTGWWAPWKDFNVEHHSQIVVDTFTVNDAAKSAFPLYPMALSDGVPFLLNEGYTANMDGSLKSAIPDEAQRHLDACRDLFLIPADLPVGAYDQPAKSLLQSSAFRKLLADNPSSELIRKCIQHEVLPVQKKPVH